jgi:hypothetical protein
MAAAGAGHRLAAGGSTLMRNLHLLDRYRDSSQRVIDLFGFAGDETCGAFFLPSPTDHAPLKVIASSDFRWEHVSVSRDRRCPNWPEMEFIKRAFFADDETVMQLHVPSKEHINCHPFCLHLWRPKDVDIPRPPGILVGPA